MTSITTFRDLSPHLVMVVRDLPGWISEIAEKHAVCRAGPHGTIFVYVADEFRNRSRGKTVPFDAVLTIEGR